MIRAVSVLALSILAAATARADDVAVPVKARQLAARGRALHEAGDYAGAIAAYNEAYVLAPRPGLLFDLAQAYRLSGDCDDAAFMYRRFLESNPREDHRAIAETNLAAVAKCGHGGLALVMLAPLPVPAVPPPAPADVATAQSPARRAAPYVAIAGAGALVVAGALALAAHDASDRVTAAYASGMAAPGLAQDDAGGRRDATLATAFGVLGGAAVVTGAILYTVGRRGEVRHVAIAAGAHGGGVLASWAF